ncbi:hypothetical protein B0H19DRAFT_1064267 [Mycena capillaripes]|nr:hypothetical protein B0H19DRAFT_1064267 [Mycena capillaripes]
MTSMVKVCCLIKSIALSIKIEINATIHAPTGSKDSRLDHCSPKLLQILIPLTFGACVGDYFTRRRVLGHQSDGGTDFFYSRHRFDFSSLRTVIFYSRPYTWNLKTTPDVVGKRVVMDSIDALIGV